MPVLLNRFSLYLFQISYSNQGDAVDEDLPPESWSMMKGTFSLFLCLQFLFPRVLIHLLSGPKSWPWISPRTMA